MASQDDVPWQALAAASGLGGVLFAVLLVADSAVPAVGRAGSAAHVGYSLAWTVTAVALLAGVYGLYRFRGDVAGTLGTLALALVGLGLVALGAGGVLAAIGAAIGGPAMVAGLALAVAGGGALGFVTFRVAGFDRRAGLLLLVALLGLVVTLALGGVVFSVADFSPVAALASVPFGLAWVVFGRSFTAQV